MKLTSTLSTVPIVLVSLVVAACGGSSGGSTASGASANSASGSAAASTSSGSKSGPLVTVAWTRDASSLDSIVASTKGFYAKHGLNVKGSYVSATTSLPEVTGKQYTVTGVADTQMFAADGEGLGLVALSGNQSDSSQDQTAGIIVGKGSGISSLKQLSGKTVGAPAVNGTLVLSTRSVVDRAGGDSKSIRFLQADSPNEPDLLKTGKLSAVLSLEPYKSELVADGYKNLGDPLRAVGDPAESDMYITSKTWAAAHPAAVAEWRAAMREADKWIAANPSKARQVLVQQKIVPQASASKFPLGDFTTAIPPYVIPRWLALMKKYNGFSSSLNPDSLIAK